jgi:4-amino-4-deoxy-L-arabinose transferase-like glycosyltransferase
MMRGRRWRAGLILIIWLGVWWRLPGLFGNTFHADEALFASWARLIAVGRDVWLGSVGVDKPPLLFYVQAPFYQMVGAVPWAARLPNWMAGVLVVPLTAVLTSHLTRNQTAPLVAALLVAASPLAIQFSPTAFTDPLMSFWLLAAVVLLVRRGEISAKRVWLVGFLLGLGVATKYQALLFLPLVLGLGWWRGWQHGRVYFSFALGLALPLTAVWLWEVGRTGQFSLWQAQMASYGGLRLAWSWELAPRLSAWGWLWLAVLGVGYGAVSWGAKRNTAVRFITLFLLVYGAGHWLVAVPVWDRYLLPLVPFTAVVIATAIRPIPHRWQPYTLWLTFLLILLLVQGQMAAHGRFPLGSTPQTDQGASEIAALLYDAPYGTVLYDHWYSWQWRYYFFDRGVYVSWFPDGAQLVQDLQVFGRDEANGVRYLVLPRGDGGQRDTAVVMQQTLQQAGFTLTPIHQTDGITLYRITPVASEQSDQ